MKYQFRFERRQYGRKTFTWAFVLNPAGQWVSLGDPWPCLNPKRQELEQFAAMVLTPGYD